jgi:hypothetical protein
MKSSLQPKIDNFDILRENYYDAHIRAYQIEHLGVKIVTSNSLGIPVIETVKPLKSYVDHTIVNM